MTCEHNNLIAAYHDGELPPEQARDVAAHLRTCGACQDELAALQAISR